MGAQHILGDSGRTMRQRAAQMGRQALAAQENRASLRNSTTAARAVRPGRPRAARVDMAGRDRHSICWARRLQAKGEVFADRIAVDAELTGIHSRPRTSACGTCRQGCGRCASGRADPGIPEQASRPSRDDARPLREASNRRSRSGGRRRRRLTRMAESYRQSWRACGCVGA